MTRHTSIFGNKEKVSKNSIPVSSTPQNIINKNEEEYIELTKEDIHFSINHLNDLEECIQYITKKVQEYPEQAFEIYKELYDMIQHEIFPILYFSFLDHKLTLKQYDELLKLYHIEKGSVDLKPKKYVKGIGKHKNGR